MGTPRRNAVETERAGPAINDMAWIPGGDFRMRLDRGRDNPGTVQAFVTGFWMDRRPVTTRQFAEFVAASGYAGWALNGSGSGLGDCPVVHVTHQDAAAYAAWAHKALPTAAEWEFAALGGGTAADDAGPVCNCDLNDCEPCGRFDSFPATTSASPNPYGLYGMTCGIWEWTADWYLPEAGRDPLKLHCAAGPGMIAGAASPDAFVPGKLIKTGSRLCACGRGCLTATSVQPIDAPANHIGFRCVASAGRGRAR